MRWNQRPKVERPEYPKLVPIAGTESEVRELLSALLEVDPAAEIVEGGGRGLYARVHNDEAEAAAKRFSETRSFPLS